MVKKRGSSKSFKSDIPDYDKVRKSYREKSRKNSDFKIYIVTGILIIGGILAWNFLELLQGLALENILLTPLAVLAFVMVWGFFLPDLIMQEVLDLVITIPDSIRILSHVIYSYLLAWLLIEFTHQVETKQNKTILILTSTILFILSLVVTITLMHFRLI